MSATIPATSGAANPSRPRSEPLPHRVTIYSRTVGEALEGLPYTYQGSATITGALDLQAVAQSRGLQGLHALVIDNDTAHAFLCEEA